MKKQHHVLKADPVHFQPLWDCMLSVQVRRNDRDFQAGDTVAFRETEYSGKEMKDENKPLEYTGRVVEGIIEFVLHSTFVSGLKSGYVVLQIR